MQTVSPNSLMQIETLDARQLTEADADAIGKLMATVWPKPEKPAEVRSQHLLERSQGYSGPEAQAPRSFVIRESGAAIAHAAIIPRTIRTTDGELTIAGLANVCSDPEHRGRGLGELITKAALELVDTGAFPYALFQTSPEVRPFYEKLGSCVVENTVVDSLSDDPLARPFSNRVVMRYPSRGDWPEGEIDLLGPGY